MKVARAPSRGSACCGVPRQVHLVDSRHRCDRRRRLYRLAAGRAKLINCELGAQIENPGTCSQSIPAHATRPTGLRCAQLTRRRTPYPAKGLIFTAIDIETTGLDPPTARFWTSSPRSSTIPDPPARPGKSITSMTPTSRRTHHRAGTARSFWVHCRDGAGRPQPRLRRVIPYRERPPGRHSVTGNVGLVHVADLASTAGRSRVQPGLDVQDGHGR